MLKGVRYRALDAGALLRRNPLFCGLTRLIVSFVGVKVIDLLLAVLGLWRSEEISTALDESKKAKNGTDSLLLHNRGWLSSIVTAQFDSLIRKANVARQPDLGRR